MIRFVSLFILLVSACQSQRIPPASTEKAAEVVAIVTDTSGTPKSSVNAYMAEDMRGNPGVLTDESGTARLGTWRPGTYTLIVRRAGYFTEKRKLTLRSGVSDTVRFRLRAVWILLQ